MVIRSKPGKASAKAKAKAEALRGSDKVEKLSVKKASAKLPPKAPLYKRAFTRSAKLDAEDIIDLIYWLRQCQAIIVGFIYGAGRVTGQIGITSFIALGLVGPTAVVKRIHDFDEEEVGKVGSAATEGMLPAFALFLLVWIISYTTFL